MGVCFLPREDARRRELEGIVEQTIEEEGQTLLGWRDVPVDHDVPGPSAAAVEPVIRQVFVGSTLGEDQDAFERKLYVIRRVIEKRAARTSRSRRSPRARSSTRACSRRRSCRATSPTCATSA